MYEFEISKDGKRILKKNHNGKYRYLGSFYNHIRDIEEFISNVGEINDSTIIITYGLADAGIEPTEQDLAMMAQGQTPQSLLS